MKPYFALMAASSLLACASGPKMNETGLASAPLRSDESRIVVYRTGILGAAIQPIVSIDGRATSRCIPQGAFAVDVVPGLHEISATTEVERSISVKAKAGETSFVRCSIGFGVLAGRPKFEVVPAAVGAAESGKLAMVGKPSS